MRGAALLVLVLLDEHVVHEHLLVGAAVHYMTGTLYDMAGPSYAGLGSGSGLVGEGSSELGSELQNCWVAFEHAGDGGCFFGEPSAASSSGSVSESSSYGMASAPRTGSEDDGASAIIRAISSLPVSFLMGVCQ